VSESKEIKIVPAAKRIAREAGIDLSIITGSGPQNMILVKDVENYKSKSASDSKLVKKGKIQGSGLARKLAKNEGVDLKTINGTGIRNRVMKQDVLRAIEGSTKKIDGEMTFGQTFPMTQIRRIISNRMTKSAFTAPHIYFFAEVVMDAIVTFRKDILKSFQEKFYVRPSINDFLIKAVALTIKEFPMINAVTRGDEIQIMPEINVGIAVALEEGLMVPSIPKSDQLGLGKIAQLRHDLVERARIRKLTIEELERGTFTISSLAQFDIQFFTAILNPPQSGILTVGKTEDRVALKDNQPIVKKIAIFGLSVDHRIIDGAMAAGFLQSLKYKIETPQFSFLDL
jgi:pyruvate dehydrogenase E2 component (dihydrolipoamide acetyltransferase)